MLLVSSVYHRELVKAWCCIKLPCRHLLSGSAGAIPYQHHTRVQLQSAHLLSDWYEGLACMSSDLSVVYINTSASDSGVSLLHHAWTFQLPFNYLSTTNAHRALKKYEQQFLLFQVTLSGVPLVKGFFIITGCRMTFLGVTWLQPWSPKPLTFGTAPSACHSLLGCRNELVLQVSFCHI